MNARDADLYVTVAEARIAKLREENARLRKALRRIEAIIGESAYDWHQPQTGALTYDAEREVLRLIRLALKAPESDR